MDFPNATEPLDLTDRPITDDLADLYVAHAARMDAFLSGRGIYGFMAAGLADILAEALADARVVGFAAAQAGRPLDS